MGCELPAWERKHPELAHCVTLAFRITGPSVGNGPEGQAKVGSLCGPGAECPSSRGGRAVTLWGMCTHAQELTWPWRLGRLGTPTFFPMDNAGQEWQAVGSSGLPLL